jgi:hypothetical protein
LIPAIRVRDKVERGGLKQQEAGGLEQAHIQEGLQCDVKFDQVKYRMIFFI